MTDNQIIDILSNNEMFNQVGMISYVLRYLGWGFIKLMAFLSNNIENVVNKIYSLNGFFSSKYVDELLHKLFPIAWGILAIAILILGFKIMLNREFKLNGLVKNILISISIVMLLPLGMSQLSKITNSAIGGLKSEYKFSADKIIKDNLYDLYYLDTVNFKPKTTLKNKLPVNSITSININEEIDSSKLKNKDVCNSKISLDKNGKKFKDGLKKGIFSLFPENYYRYSFKFWTIAISIGCITFTLLVTSIKISRIIFELGFIKLFGILYSFADLSTGQKNKEIIRCIVSNFVVLFVISVLLKLYLLFSAWSTESSKGVVQIILLIGASMAVIDGPNIVERILGIDCGIKDGWNTITGINSAFNTIAQTSHGISKVMGSAVNGIANVSSSAVGMYNGFKEGMKPLEEQMNDKPLSNLGGFGNEDKDNKPDLKEQTSLYDEMQSQDINNGFEDISQSSNIEGDNQSSNSSNDIDSKVDSNSDINSKGSMEDNNNLEMNQDFDQNLSSKIDANNSLSNNSNTSLDNDMNKSSSSSYQNANNNKTGNNIKSSDEGHITSNENNKNDNTVANSLLENEMLSITDSSNNNSTLESEMGSQSDVSKDIGTDMQDYNSSLGTQSMDSGVGATEGDMSDYYSSLGTQSINSGVGATESDMSDYYSSLGSQNMNSGIGATEGDISDYYSSLGSQNMNSGIETTEGDMSDYYSSLGSQSINKGIEATQSNIADTSSIDKTTINDMESISDSKNSNIGNTIKSNSIDKGMSKQNSNTSTFNKTPNIEASINNNTSSPNLNTNPNVVNQGFAKVKSPVEHRTLSEHIKSNFQESTTFRGMKQNYSVGRNTGMRMANLIRNRKNKKDK